MVLYLLSFVISPMKIGKRSLEPGSALGEKEKKRGEIGKISVREANRARCSGEGERERGFLVPKPRSVSQVLCHVPALY